MNIHLAESCGAWKAYFKNGRENDAHLLREADSRIKANGKEEGGGSDERFLADSEFLKGYLNGARENHIFQGCNILQSFYYVDDFTTKEILPNCKRFLLDSGAFTFLSSGGKADWNEYIKRYAKFINDYNVELFFELDIDPVVGYKKVLDYRKMLEDLTGKPSIPVWHKSRGYDDFIKRCEEYKYVAVGGIVTKEIERKDHPIFAHLIHEAHKRGAKIHGLGYTNLEGLTKYKFDSVDSTAWISGNKFGGVYWFDGKTMQKRGREAGQRMTNAKALAIHNFTEWKKFAKYAETHL